MERSEQVIIGIIVGVGSFGAGLIVAFGLAATLDSPSERENRLRQQVGELQASLTKEATARQQQSQAVAKAEGERDASVNKLTNLQDAIEAAKASLDAERRAILEKPDSASPRALPAEPASPHLAIALLRDEVDEFGNRELQFDVHNNSFDHIKSLMIQIEFRKSGKFVDTETLSLLNLRPNSRKVGDVSIAEELRFDDWSPSVDAAIGEAAFLSIDVIKAP